MSLFSFLRKNKQESDPDDSTFYSRAEEDSKAAARSRKRGRGKSDEGADPVLPEKKRARRRLIGAVALVLAAVVGLPMILDSEPKPLADDIEIRIPSRERTAAAAVNKPDNQAASLDAEEEVVEPSVPPPPPVASTPAPGPAAKAATEKPAAPAVAAKAPTEPASKAAEKPARDKSAVALAKPEAKPEPKPEAKPAVPKDDARARALLEGKTDIKTDIKAEKKDTGKYVIQVAALATKDKVNELQSRLKSAGISSYTQTVSTATGERTRIRVGPFGSRDEAEKVRAKIVSIGLNGTLVPA